jgi:hypothetical protein
MVRRPIELMDLSPDRIWRTNEPASSATGATSAKLSATASPGIGMSSPQKIADYAREALALFCLEEAHGDYRKALALARKRVPEKAEQQEVVVAIAKLKIVGHWRTE